MVFSALVIIFLILEWRGQLPILRSIQYVTFKYAGFQKASRILSISINSIGLNLTIAPSPVVVAKSIIFVSFHLISSCILDFMFQHFISCSIWFILLFYWISFVLFRFLEEMVCMYVPDILRCTYIHVRCTANRFLKILTYFSVTNIYVWLRFCLFF